MPTSPATFCAGAHILSGNVFEPRALDELLPGWRESGAPVETRATDDKFLALTETSSLTVPNFLLPPQLHNDVGRLTSSPPSPSP